MNPSLMVTDNTYANTGANRRLLTEEADETPPPPPKSRPPALTPPPVVPYTATSDSSDTTSDFSRRLRHPQQAYQQQQQQQLQQRQQQQASQQRSQQAQQRHESHSTDGDMVSSSMCSTSSLPRPTSRSQFPRHEPHYHTHSLNRRTSGTRPGTSIGFTHPHASRSYVKSPGVTFSCPTPTPFDEEFLCQLPVEDLVARIKVLEAKNRKLVVDNGHMMKTLNQHIASLQSLKYQNFRLTSDNNELRDLTVYLDDERNRTRGLAKQWQDFGNHMSTVMKHEVGTYAKKLHLLEDKQFELVRENFELRQLCVLMDKAMNMRNSGDNNNRTGVGSAGDSDGSNGSSGLTDAASDASDNNTNNQLNNHNNSTSHLISSRGQNHVMISKQILEYIHSLEQRISQLEWEKKQLSSSGGTRTGVSDGDGTKCDSSVATADSLDQGIGSCTYDGSHVTTSSPLATPGVIMEAMRSLRLRDESGSTSSSTLKDLTTPTTTTATSSATSSVRSRSLSPRKPSTRI